MAVEVVVEADSRAEAKTVADARVAVGQEVGPRAVSRTARNESDSEKTEWPILPGAQFHSAPPAVQALR